MIGDPTGKVWEVDSDRGRVVFFLHNFLNASEDVLDDSTDPEELVGGNEINELATMALQEFAGTDPISNYAEAVLRLCIAFVGGEEV